MTNSKIALYHTVRNFILFASMVVILDFEKNLGRYSSLEVSEVKIRHFGVIPMRPRNLKQEKVVTRMVSHHERNHSFMKIHIP